MEKQLNTQGGEEQPSPLFDKFITPSSSASEGWETEYESGEEELTSRLKKKPHGEGADFNPKDDEEHQSNEIPLRPCLLEFNEEEGTSAPKLMLTTSSEKSKRKRGQHGRHQLPTKVFAIHEVGKKGEPLEPVSVISKFSNACGVLVRERVDFNIDEWKKVDVLLKNSLWEEIKRRFTYPLGTNEELNRSYALSTCAKALRQFRWKLNQKYVKKGEMPFKEYGFITQERWDKFVRYHTSEDAMDKSEKFSLLAKRNLYPHHLGSTGYVVKKKKWRREEREAVVAGKPIEYEGLNERTRDFLKARRPKQLAQGKSKFNEPQTEEAEKKILAFVTAEQAGTFTPHREKDQLSAALGNPEHRGRVRGMSSRMSWKDAWAIDAGSCRTQQGYKEKLIQETSEETMREIVMEEIRNVLTSGDPKMVQLRSQFLGKASSMELMQRTQLDQGLSVPSSSASTVNQPADDIVSCTSCSLHIPVGRKKRMMEVATGMAIPGRTFQCQPIPIDYAKVLVVDVHPNHQRLEIDLPTKEGIRYLGDAKDNLILWNRYDIILTTASPPLPPVQLESDNDPLQGQASASGNVTVEGEAATPS